MSVDWTYLAHIKGTPLESLIAVWLRKRHPNSRQVQPGNRGDGGIDIYLDDPRGLIVWQVKGFTAPLTTGQWSQVQDSWTRFNEEHVNLGEKIASYALVTPWTPTMPRLQAFDAMTAGACFDCSWDSDAWLQGLDADYPEVTERWLHGAQALDRQIMAKAVLASSAPTAAENMSFVEALKSRDLAMGDLWDKASDNYLVNTGFKSFPSARDLPLPGSGEPGVMHRYELVGPNRWYVQSVVPRGADSTNVEPMKLTLDFSQNVGTDKEQGIRDWLEWGAAITEPTPALVQQTGGPFADPEPVERVIDRAFLGDVSGKALQHWEFELAIDDGEDGDERVLPLRLVEYTMGAVTGWMRWVLETPGHLIRFEVRYTGHPVHDRNGTDLVLNGVLGHPIGPLLEDVAALRNTTATTRASIRTTAGSSLVQMTGRMAGDGFEQIHELLAALALLQEHSDETFLAPDLFAVTDDELRSTLALRDVYAGTPFESTWTAGTIPPLGEEQAEVARLDGSPFTLKQSSGFICGGKQYVVSRPVMHHLYSVVSETRRASAHTYTPVVPGEDDRLVVWADPDWTAKAHAAGATGQAPS